MTAVRKTDDTLSRSRQRKAAASDETGVLSERSSRKRTRKLVAYQSRASAADLERYQRWLGVFR